MIVSYNDYKLYRTQIYVVNPKQQNPPSEVSNKIEGPSQLPEIIKQVVDKLTGKDMEVTYDFQNLQIDVPRVSGPGGKELGSARWKINGKFVLSTALLNNSNAAKSNERNE